MSKLSYGDLVSVVIPAYNHQDYIRETLDSVYKQTYQNIELIVLDDCSKDNSLVIAEQWAKEKYANKRFSRVIIEKNAHNFGAHDAINKGLTIAQGKALTILNSDDMYASLRIETLMKAAEEHKSDWLFSGIRVINAKGKRSFSELAIEIEAFSDLACNYPAVSFAVLKKNIAVTAGNLLFSRDIFNQVGNFCRLRYCYDWDFALQACLISEPMLVNEPLYNYRINETNTFSHLNAEEYLEAQIGYRRYFAACQAGRCINPMAPWFSNWPGLFEKWIVDDQTLKWIFNLVGHDTVKFDFLSRAINRSIS